MRKQKSEAGSWKKRWRTMIALACVFLPLLYSPAAKAVEKWSGVDESVVEKYAQEQGREAREPFINTNQGDLLLFVFLLAGTLGGFAAGYFWREIVERRDQGGSRVG